MCREKSCRRTFAFGREMTENLLWHENDSMEQLREQKRKREREKERWAYKPTPNHMNIGFINSFILFAFSSINNRHLRELLYMRCILIALKNKLIDKSAICIFNYIRSSIHSQCTLRQCIYSDVLRSHCDGMLCALLFFYLIKTFGVAWECSK